LIYYSSLFYSMDAGEAKGEHGGIHEAAIGLGNMSGPLIGALALQIWPARPESGAIAVSLLLVGGWLALLRLRLRQTRGTGTGSGAPALSERRPARIR